jgi:hypothetical protein
MTTNEHLADLIKKAAYISLPSNTSEEHLRIFTDYLIAHGVTVQQSARPLEEWGEDYGDVLWWKFPIEEPPYVGSPLDANWPAYHTHWTPIVCPEPPEELPMSEEKTMTNADRIRAMTDAELAEKIYQLNTLNAEGRDFSLLFCDGKANCIDAAGNISCNDEREKACILRWLRQIAEE